MEDKHYNKIPIFENGMAQPVFPFTDGKSGENYDPATSDIVRYCVYVESDYDMDGDGKRDLVKVLIQVPRSAVEGNYKAASLFEARPYCAGVQADGYDHMKEVESKEYRPFDFSVLDKKVPARVPTGSISAMDLALKADPADWYYPDKGDNDSMVYENLENFNYYLIRGFAVIVSAGFGALGSDGFNYVGSSYERDAFKSVVEWLHGDRVAYADREGTIETKADWSNGNVAMTGRSYAGTMPFAVATTGVEGLKTIVPVAGISDWYSQQNMQGAQRYWPKEMLNSFLAYFCSSRYNDSTLSEKQLDDIAAFHHELSLQQLKCGFDYDEKFWGSGNYRLQADNIKCSALIVQGLNDENVSTKQFEMMYKAYKKSGQTVKTIVHQGPHITPTLSLIHICMLSVLIGAVTNIILDPILIFGFDMGVKGAALATIISQTCSCIWVLAFLFGKKTTLRIQKKYMHLQPNVFLPTLALGLATFIMQSSESIISVCFNSSLLKYGGDIAVGAMTILTSVMQFAMLPLQGLGPVSYTHLDVYKRQM